MYVLYEQCGRVHLGLLFDVLEEGQGGVGSRLGQGSERVLLEGRPVEETQLHGPHVGGEEGLP